MLGNTTHRGWSHLRQHWALLGLLDMPEASAGDDCSLARPGAVKCLLLWFYSSALCSLLLQSSLCAACCKPGSECGAGLLLDKAGIREALNTREGRVWRISKLIQRAQPLPEPAACCAFAVRLRCPGTPQCGGEKHPDLGRTISRDHPQSCWSRRRRTQPLRRCRP